MICYHCMAVVRVYLVHLMNAEYHKAATNLWTKQTRVGPLV